LQSGDALTELLQTLKQRQLELAEENNHYVPLVLKVAPDLTPEDINLFKQLLKFKIDGLIVTNTTLGEKVLKICQMVMKQVVYQVHLCLKKVQNVYASLLSFRWKNSFNWCGWNCFR
jgi:dihydroorotate dehydrogenase